MKSSGDMRNRRKDERDMPFWKKSEDPWDIDPEKQRRPTPPPEDGQADPDTGLLEDLRAWNEARKEKKARQEMPPEPIPCPWCGKEMEPRYVWGARGVYLGEKRPTLFSSGFSDDNQDFLDEGNPLICSYKTVWICRDCQKLVADLPEPPPSLWDTVPQENAANEREEEH